MSINLDDAVLALTGITYPEHNLKVRRAPQKPPNKESKRVNIPSTYKRVNIPNTLTLLILLCINISFKDHFHN